MTGITVFVSYSPEDRYLWRELEKYLIPLKRKQLITIWDPHNRTHAVQERELLRMSRLNSADIILLLISPDYIASDYLYEVEMRLAIDRFHTGEAQVFPILLHPVYWQDEPFSQLSILPENHRPVSLWHKKQSAFLQIASGIRRAVAQLLSLPDAKEVRALIHERVEAPREPLHVGETYTLQLDLQPVEGSTSAVESEVHLPFVSVQQDPDTEWFISAHNVRLGLDSDDMTATRSETSLVSFLIPSGGGVPSLKQLSITPQALKDARLNILIYSHGELYREALITFTVDEAQAISQLQATHPVIVESETTYALAHQLGLHVPYDWQLPPSDIGIVVLDSNTVFVKGSRVAVAGELMYWCGTMASVAGLIEQVRQCAKRLFTQQGSWFEDIDVLDLLSRLEHFCPQPDWAALHEEADDHHLRIWDDHIKNSEELHQLAICGHYLYEQIFPVGSQLRSVLDTLESGSSLSIHWTQKSGHHWISSVPWGFMYAKKPELPIDPCNFLGLRFRIHYRSYTPEEPVKKRRRDLGTPSKSYRGNCFYWDVENDDDPTIREAMWQHSLWSNWPNQICIPENYTEPHLKPKEALLKLLRTSGARRPMPLLYFYCKCDFPESRNQPVLRFANNNDAANLVSHLDLFQSEFVDSPLVFMNACITSASDPYYANELQAFFIRRGCSAYLGTEAEVPVHLGSCFAVIFFHFFYRKMKDWPEPISAGEAMAQARLFLWTQYKNIGGLLYTYINQSQLFMADAVELEKLRNTPTRMMDYPYIQRPLD